MRAPALVAASAVARDARRPSRSTSWSQQEYIPSDVDEAEFEVSVNAPGGDEPRRDGRGDARGRGRALRDAAACGPCSPRRAAASSAASTRATPTCASRRTRSARSRSAASSSGARPARPGRRVPRQLLAARRDERGPRERLREVSATCASRCATSRPSTSAAATVDIDFVLRGPGPRGAGRVRRATCARRARRARRHRRRRHHAASSTSPSCASTIDRDRAADLGVDIDGHRAPRCG